MNPSQVLFFSVVLVAILIPSTARTFGATLCTDDPAAPRSPPGGHGEGLAGSSRGGREQTDTAAPSQPFASAPSAHPAPAEAAKSVGPEPIPGREAPALNLSTNVAGGVVLGAAALGPQTNRLREDLAWQSEVSTNVASPPKPRVLFTILNGVPAGATQSGKDGKWRDPPPATFSGLSPIRVVRDETREPQGVRLFGWKW